MLIHRCQYILIVIGTRHFDITLLAPELYFFPFRKLKIVRELMNQSFFEKIREVSQILFYDRCDKNNITSFAIEKYQTSFTIYMR
jgi:hypothetical protein